MCLQIWYPRWNCLQLWMTLSASFVFEAHDTFIQSLLKGLLFLRDLYVMEYFGQLRAWIEYFVWHIYKVRNVYKRLTSMAKQYSIKTFLRGQKFSPWILRSAPARLKNLLQRTPPTAIDFGIRPSNSIIYAKWSSSLP